MSSVRPPPRRDAPSRVLLRFLLLVLLLLIAATAIWTAVTRQRVDLTEKTSLSSLDVDTIREVDGTAINVVQKGLGSTPFVLLHDVDVAGGVLWDQVAEALGDDATVVIIDLPGFGLSERIPDQDARHTVAGMAEIVATAVEPRFAGPVVFGGAGLGGEVAAEIAVTHPELVSGLVLIDVDFYKGDGWREFIEKLPWIGLAATYALETGGPFAFDLWAPECETGGWCPTQSQVAARDLAETIVATTESTQAFLLTPGSSLVPSRLPDIAVPTIFVWSEGGEVPKASVDKAVAAVPDARLETAQVWKAQLDSPQQVAGLLWSFSP